MSQDDSAKLNGKKATKKTPNDFIFGKVIGEGSFSTVYLAKEIESGNEFAVKVLDKRHIMREKKTQYVMREKEVLMKLNHAFFIRLFYTFQDHDRLYFVLSYARQGELLDYLNRLSCFDENSTKWYAAELVLALEHMHNLGVIHRDLKPENILLNDGMHIQITDFGSSKILDKQESSNSGQEPSQESGNQPKRKNSFVGTAQYVSPEILTSKTACSSSDLWALGCIIYQLLSGLVPFRGGHEYQIFQKIMKLEYEFPDGFSSVARDLVEKLLVIEPSERLGCPEQGGYERLKQHPFFEGIDWDIVPEQKPPTLQPYLPATSENPENIYGNYKPGLSDRRVAEIITETVISDDERKSLIEAQAKENEYHKFVEGNLILKQGLVDKRKGLFARRRMFLLTEGPHLYYVDPTNKVLKGQIPWSKELKPEAKNFKTFFVHTPNRTYYLEDKSSRSQDWVNKIDEVWQTYYGTKS
ncbi:3-phosphoinositide-dependent protein kinase 1-like [Mizuhopecten yessoensis]|uniref:3-phosphoinositide-dependent protein kinase 1 n=1 Tax=Mizuhopecten yessoensis TaxID=6573 RepID=A0A210QNJ9_MIZYE|nr:3-phosphoinositide-dependent protein kinase 1-like [Mizuhopecten yessoensis]OWF50313.1 3-phosphoinositide-dependent protein kinase 1 [Mizuhopecten yessoensis]